jgi:hypothetical protein
MKEEPENWRRQQTYKIVRYYAPHLKKRPRTMETGLTLEEAQAHCKNPKTSKRNTYFDGYTAH